MSTAALDRSAFARARTNARARLLAERAPSGHWVGELSSSALSTATASAAFALAARAVDAEQARVYRAYANAGRAWLAANQNVDGGFGDTTDSPSNLSTSALAWMALGSRLGADDDAAARGRCERALGNADGWLANELGISNRERVTPRLLADALARVYGDDKTFAVPILVACAAGEAYELDDPLDAWREIPPLPFELAALPKRLFKWLGLPVVSYALPALIAIGQVIHAKSPTRNPLTRALRVATRGATLTKLEAIQPANGGFLEATPLTSFVVMSLIAAGRTSHPVTTKGLAFLGASMRDDGAWPIDTDLATWVSTLSIGALSGAGVLGDALDADERVRLTDWLLAQQYDDVHPYTGAAPGGWAWTDLPGGVPDADDTPGALLALHALCGTDDARALAAARRGRDWLCALQNRDGGIPTFCRGWGTLPFDQSCPDLTAHALRAWDAWADALGERDASRARRAAKRATAHLVRTQREDGAWVPLWFGNQFEARLENPVYGTSRVLRAAGVCGGDDAWRRALERGAAWLLAAQAADGGFGGSAGLPPSIEETALALEALAALDASDIGDGPAVCTAVERGARWLVSATAEGTRFEARPIGLYFAKLWYSERLYPLAFTVSAFERCAAILAR